MTRRQRLSAEPVALRVWKELLREEKAHGNQGRWFPQDFELEYPLHEFLDQRINRRTKLLVSGWVFVSEEETSEDPEMIVDVGDGLVITQARLELPNKSIVQVNDLFEIDDLILRLTQTRPEIMEDLDLVDRKMIGTHVQMENTYDPK